MTTKKITYRGVDILDNPLSNSKQIILPYPYGSYVSTVARLKRIIDRYHEREAEKSRQVK